MLEHPFVDVKPLSTTEIPVAKSSDVAYEREFGHVAAVVHHAFLVAWRKVVEWQHIARIIVLSWVEGGADVVAKGQPELKGLDFCKLCCIGFGFDCRDSHVGFRGTRANR